MGNAGYFIRLFKSQLFFTPPIPTSNYDGQVIIVTGSNTGLGFEAVKYLIRLGASKVILAVRTIKKGEKAVEDIIASTKCSPSRLEVWPLDLSSSASIKAFGARAQTLTRLDAVIQNAGILTNKWGTAEGNEQHVTVNIIGASLLGLEVLPKLRESAKKTGLAGRLSFVGSDLHIIAKFTERNASGGFIPALNNKENADMADRYATSKLLLLYFVRELARLSPISTDSNVIINFMSPGACATEIFRDDSTWLQRLGMRIMFFLVARSPEVGGRTLVDAIKPTIGPEAHGAFLWDCKLAEEGLLVVSEEGSRLQERFSKELLGVLEGIDPGVVANATAKASA